MHTSNGTRCDVAILGAGMAGTILGTILARHGVDVVILDAQTHPRFAVGESTIPHTSLLLSILAEQYRVPEIEYLAYPDKLAANVCTSCGIKRSFGFAYQRPGTFYDHSEGIQFGTSSKDENHLYRQDIDAWLLHLAVHYGARSRMNERVKRLDIDESGATIDIEGGAPLRARYVVDGTGHRSYLADKYGLRSEPNPLLHHSRSLFTHMVDVDEFEQPKNPLSLPWEKTTLHHAFDGGWFWVIPFNNHELSRNPLVSVGLTIDSKRFPRPGHITPEEEFVEFLKQFPSVQGQFRNAKAVRPWVSTGRLQYASNASTGYRFALMSHAAGFIDPLYSRGLINTTEIIAALLPPLLGAIGDGDFTPERFEGVDAMQKRLISYNDRVVHWSFRSWRDFDLWNAWARVWALGTIITEFRLLEVLSDFTRTHDENVLHGAAGNPIFSDLEDPDYSALFTRACAVMQEAEAGTVPPAEASQRLFSMMGEFPFPVLLSLEGMRRAKWLKADEEISEKNLQAARAGYRWALANPKSRDLFGNTRTFYRWRARQDDPHIPA